MITLSMTPAEFNRKMNRLRKELLQHDEIEDIAKAHLQVIKNNMRRGRSGDGRSLPRLAESTLRQRRAKGISSTTPMRATAEYANSITTQTDVTGIGNDKETTVMIGPNSNRNTKIAAVHRGGSTRFPKRDVLRLPDRFESEVDQKVTSDLKRKVRKVLR